MASNTVRKIIIAILLVGILGAHNGVWSARAAAAGDAVIVAKSLSAANPTAMRSGNTRQSVSFTPGQLAQSICVGQLFCSPVVAQVGNPPASAAWYGITQATFSYPGYNFGPIFLAHVGTPEGWAFYGVKPGDTVRVQWADGSTSGYRVTSIRRYKLVAKDRMVDLDSGGSYTNLEVYAMNQSSPSLSLETCIPNPQPTNVTGSDAQTLGSWGRMFIQAEPLQ